MADISSINQARITGSEREEGFLARLLQRMMAAREEQARRAVDSYLLTLDDRTRGRLGYEREHLLRNSRARTRL